MKSILAFVAILAIIPAASTATSTAAPQPNATSTEIIRTAVTASGQPLRLPQGKAEMVGYTVDIPADGLTTIHQHPWSRFVYVEHGPLTVTDQDTGRVHRFETGQAFAEVVAQWHQGHAPGPTGARLIVIDLVPPGVTNMTMR
jgi:quercetin dioxygenase-like cupin family protein